MDQKKKKEQRGELLQMLESVKADDDELRQMTSLSAIQTKGIRRVQASREHVLSSSLSDCLLAAGR